MSRSPPNSSITDDARRRQSAASWQRFAAQCYFTGSVAGLMVNSAEVASVTKLMRDEEIEEEDGGVQTLVRREAVRRKYLKAFVMLLKSCCDVLVFSNNGGVDLHLKYRGHKMSEIVHCICGLISASVVIFNNFPNEAS